MSSEGTVNTNWTMVGIGYQDETPAVITLVPLTPMERHWTCMHVVSGKPCDGDMRFTGESFTTNVTYYTHCCAKCQRRTQTTAGMFPRVEYVPR